jgi:outer membrane protein OmpA-like peptidoglycan-associated protein
MPPKTIRTLFITFAAACIFSLISCAGSQETVEAPPPEPEEPEVVVVIEEPAPVNRYIEITDIYFDKGKFSLDATAVATLEGKAEWLLENPEVNILLQGHSDEPGSAEDNLALGLRRAGSVKSYLLKQGIEGKRLAAVSFGKEQPVTTSDDEISKTANRRVHFVIDALQ